MSQKIFYMEIDRTDLANMIRGTSPHYDLFEHPLLKKSGSYTGGQVDQWNWSYKFEDRLTDEELQTLYFVCKNYGK